MNGRRTWPAAASAERATGWTRTRSGWRDHLLRTWAAILIALTAFVALWGQSAPPTATASASASSVLSSPLDQYLGLRVSSIGFKGLHEDEQVRRYLVDS